MLLPWSARVERRAIAASLRVEPVALQHAVVQRRIRVDAGFEQLVVLDERRRAIVLVAIGRQDRPVLSVGQRHLGPARQAERRVLDVRGRERRVGVVRRRRKAARQREQMLALFVQHVLLLPVEIFDRKAVDRELGELRHPLLHRRQRDAEQLGAEPRAHLREPGEQNLHLLPPRVHLVVALILVVLQGHVVPDLVRELSDLVRDLVGGQQALQDPAQACPAAPPYAEIFVSSSSNARFHASAS